MKKEWFIFKGTHHHGPYTLAELLEFYKNSELTDQSLVWKEGSEKWEAFAKTPELTNALKGSRPAPKKESLPAMPPLPVLPDLPEDDQPPVLPKFLAKAEASETAETEAEEADVPPPLPLDVLLDPEGVREKTTDKPKWRYALWGSAAVLFIILTAWFINSQMIPAAPVKIKGIMPVYLERLQETAQLKTPNLMVSMALSLDGKSIWVTTNKSGIIPATIKLESLPKRTLGSQDIALTVRGTIRNHVGQFSRMQLTKGSQFVPGEYRMSFTGKKIHLINEHLKFLASLDLFKKLNSTYKFEGEALIYAGTPREFEKKLLDYQEGLLNEKLKPFHDKLERLSTFTSLLNQTAENYLRTLEKISRGMEISQFEKSYQQEISPIIQSLVVAAIDLSRNPDVKEDFRNPLAPYKQQIELGKQIGEMASDMITETKKIKKLSGKDKNALKQKFEIRYKNIKLQLDLNTKKLQDHIKKISV